MSSSLLKQYSAQDRLRDGRPILIRQIRADEQSTLTEVITHLSKKSRYFRYLTYKNEPSVGDLTAFTDINQQHHVALVARLLVGDVETPLGLGEYYVNRDNETTAELAFAVEEEYQGLGVATALLKHLSLFAIKAGVAEFTALVHPDNRKMMHVLEHCGYPIEVHRLFAANKVLLTLAK